MSPAPQPPSSPAPPTEAEPKDDWDASSDEENVPPATHPDGGDDVKSDWDASSDEDEPAPDVKGAFPGQTTFVMDIYEMLLCSRCHNL